MMRETGKGISLEKYIRTREFQYHSSLSQLSPPFFVPSPYAFSLLFPSCFHPLSSPFILPSSICFLFLFSLLLRIAFFFFFPSSICFLPSFLPFYFCVSLFHFIFHHVYLLHIYLCKLCLCLQSLTLSVNPLLSRASPGCQKPPSLVLPHCLLSSSSPSPPKEKD
jgi:hypothetical protein